MTYHCWSSSSPLSVSPSTATATSCSSVTALRHSRAMFQVLRPVLLLGVPVRDVCSVPGRAQPLEHQAEQLLETEIDCAKEEAERGRERHNHGCHVGCLARWGPVDLPDLALQIAEQSHQALPAP